MPTKNKKRPIPKKETIKIDLGFYKLASELGDKNLPYGEFKGRLMKYLANKKK